jgi:hypothetical protein
MIDAVAIVVRIRSRNARLYSARAPRCPPAFDARRSSSARRFPAPMKRARKKVQRISQGESTISDRPSTSTPATARSTNPADSRMRSRIATCFSRKE